DPRESPSFKLLELLVQKGAKVTHNDPYIPAFPMMRHYKHLRIKPVALTESELAAADAAVIMTDHSDYDYEAVVKHAPLVIDTRNACGFLTHSREKIVRA